MVASLENSPRLITWAINTDNLAALCRQSEISVGSVHQASRDDLRWKVALTDDGRLSAAGFFPLCIQWQIDFHPSEKMADLGCRLEGIELYHPYPKWLQSVLASAGAAHLVNIHPSDSANPVRIDAIISTPGGVATLSSVI